MEYEILEISGSTIIPLLKEFTYEAVYVPEGTPLPDRSIIETPQLSVYYMNFGTEPDDCCLAAVQEGRTAGLVWSRIMNDYGHTDDETPSLAIAVKKEYRNKGIGTALMKQMLDLLKRNGYTKASVSVQKDNYAVKMYRKLGFAEIRQTDEEYIMVCRL